MASETPPLEESMRLLGGPKHLQREKGLKGLTAILQSQQDTHHAAVKAGITDLLAQKHWEKKLGGLMAAKAYILLGQPADTYLEQLRQAALGLLEDGEVRVRLAVGDCFKALASRQGLPLVESCMPPVLDSICRNFERSESADDGAAEGPDGQRLATAPMTDFVSESPALPGSPVQRPSSPLRDTRTGEAGGQADSAVCSYDSGGGSNPVSLVTALLQSTYRHVRPGVGEMRHGTEGWKCLETSMKALQSLVEGCGSSVRPLLDESLLALLYKALHHPNRFVRETGHFTMCTVCEALRGPELAAIAGRVAELLADGMGDNWSQVRYAACVSTRSLLEWLGDCPEREVLMPVLLPPMCLNRYYVAEGVRLYAQDTWRRVMGGGGRAAVAAHINPVVAHYCAQARANNHAVREAACACMAELMEKVDRSAVSPHVPALFRSLVLCFKDMSWPVRDAACIAAGRAVLSYPNEMRPLASEMLGLWLEHLADNIPTVRANSAVALAKAVRAYGDEVLPALLGALDSMLPAARSQPAESAKYWGLSNDTRFGVAARKARDNDPQVHSDQEMFSCGSLLARFSTSYLIRSDGCMDHGFSRDKEPWEVSDGAVHLLRELAAVRPEAITDKHWEALVELGSLASFQHAFNLHETVWRSLRALGEAVGKPRFKRHLRPLLVPLAADCCCGHQLAEAAAQQALTALRDWLGPNILAGYMPEGTNVTSLIAGVGPGQSAPRRPPPLAGLLGSCAVAVPAPGRAPVGEAGAQWAACKQGTP